MGKDRGSVGSGLTPLVPSREAVGVDATPSGDNYDVSKCPAPMFGRAVTRDHMIHGLCYILRQIEGCNHYRPNIGQSESATSALRMALALLIPEREAPPPQNLAGEGEGEAVVRASPNPTDISREPEQ